MTQRYEPNVPGSSGPNIETHTTVVAPIDRLRWAGVLGGLFVALSAFVVLSLLGAAIGLAAYDVGDTGRSYGIGAGIWGGISLLLAFLAGGWVAARAAAVRGSNNGMMNGAMVWAVAIPLMFYLLSGALGSLLGRDASDVERVIHASIRSDDTGQARVEPQQQQQAARTGRNAATGALISVLLGLGASVVGGYAGARGYEGRRDRDLPGGEHGESRTRPRNP